MPWAEISPGCWERPLGENESMIKLIGDGGNKVGKDVWSISATARFSAHLSSKPLIQALQDGWTRLRFRHPSIAATIKTQLAEDEQKAATTIQYLVPSPEDLTNWVNETFIILDNDNDLETVIRNLRPSRYPTCYYLKNQATILMHNSHWRTDGIGAFHLLAELFRTTIEDLRQSSPLELPWGDETARLLPSVEEALCLPQTPTEAIRQAANHYLQTVSHTAGAVDIPLTFFPRPSTTSSSPSCDDQSFTQIANYTFTQAETAALIAACSKVDGGISLESALHASVTETAYNLFPATAVDDKRPRDRELKPACHHTSTLRHSLRPHLPAPYDSVPGACGLYTAGYMVKVPPSNNWLENARYFYSEYNSSAGDMESLLCSRREYAKLMMGRLRAAAAASTTPGANGNGNSKSGNVRGGLDFSWIPEAEGLVDAIYSTDVGAKDQQQEKQEEWILVEEIGIGIEVLTRHVYVFAWVVDGRLGMRAVWNGTFFGDGMGEEVLRLVREVLIENLLTTRGL